MIGQPSLNPPEFMSSGTVSKRYSDYLAFSMLTLGG